MSRTQTKMDTVRILAYNRDISVCIPETSCYHLKYSDVEFMPSHIQYPNIKETWRILQPNQLCKQILIFSY